MNEFGEVVVACLRFLLLR